MGSHVGGQVVAVTETPPTDVTGKRPLAAVAPQVRRQLTLLVEAFLAGQTWERFLSSVDLRVSLLVVPLTEAFATGETLVGFLPCVSPEVTRQVAAAEEALPAHLALIRPLPGVDPGVETQTDLVGEAPPTSGAGERLLPRVEPQVFGQVTLLAETFRAHITEKLLLIRSGGFIVALGADLQLQLLVPAGSFWTSRDDLDRVQVRLPAVWFRTSWKQQKRIGLLLQDDVDLFLAAAQIVWLVFDPWSRWFLIRRFWFLLSVMLEACSPRAAPGSPGELQQSPLTVDLLLVLDDGFFQLGEDFFSSSS